MPFAWIFAAGLVAGTPPSDPSPRPEVALAYREASAKAGRSPEDQVRLALWCEARGLTAERLRHLALAILADPGNGAARGLMGLVSHQGRWMKPEAVAALSVADPILAEYESRRLKAPYTADGQWTLANWAEDHGLIQQARAHLSAVIRLDPAREAAWKKLGYRRFDGRWRTDAQVSAEKADSEAQERADRTWTATLARWRGWLSKPDRRSEAEANLDDLTDPRAVPSVVKVFGSGGPDGQAIAVRLLGQIEGPGSSRSLASLATWGKSPEVRRVAAEILAHRDPREFLGMLIGRLRKPIRYEMGLHLNANGTQSPHFVAEGEKARAVVMSAVPYGYDHAALDRNFADSMPFDPYGFQAAQMDGNFGSSPGAAALVGQLNAHAPKGTHPGGGAGFGAMDPASAMVYQATQAASFRDSQVAATLARGPNMGLNFLGRTGEFKGRIDSYNAEINRENPPIYASLEMITGQDLPEDPEPWKKWWVDSLGYSLSSSQSDRAEEFKPTFVYHIASCFAAGTPVRTLSGDRPIESLKVGDQVLAQETATGGLRYRTISGIHHNPPAMVLRVKFGDETIFATGFHRFWKAGKGWVMARELKAGDPIRTLEGVMTVASVEPDRVQPVFNLDVADDADFFVGRLGALVHDNTLPDPRTTPFDVAPKAVR